MARMTIDRAVEILSEASRGIMTTGAEFKVACAMGKKALQQILVEHMKADEDFMEGCRRGLAAAREEKVRPWSEVKAELGIKEPTEP